MLGTAPRRPCPTVLPVLPGTKTRLAPQVVAYGMTYGGAFSGKQAVLQPRSFGVVGAYDGHAVDVGRVAVDSTWHHFVNITHLVTTIPEDRPAEAGLFGPYWERYGR